jgi:AcrR family transcriptional regulator
MQTVSLSIDNPPRPRHTVLMQAPGATDRQDAILDAAFHLFAGYGYRRVSMEDIAHRLGLSRTALYQHFRSKDDIFRSLADRHFATSLAAMRAVLAEPAADAAAQLRAAFAAKDGKFMEVVLGTPHGRELLDAGFALAAGIAGEAEAAMAGVLADWIGRADPAGRLGPPAAAAQMVMAALKGLKTSAASPADYREGQAALARILAAALAPTAPSAAALS